MSKPKTSEGQVKTPAIEGKGNAPDALGAIENLSLELRARIATQLLAGSGSAEEIVSELAAGFGRKVQFKAVESEGSTTDLVVEVSHSSDNRESLDEAGIRKIRALLESPEAGYAGCALQMLKNANIDPDNLPEGSAPLWKSPEAALTELLANLTPAMLEVIDRNFTTPVIVIEPIMSHEAVYVKDHKTKDCDRRIVGDTPFSVSEWAAKDLGRADIRNRVGSIDGQRIADWCIGFADNAQVTKILESDGDVNTKTLEDRAKDFNSEGGHGTLGFVSAVDHPVLYGLMMNKSRSGDTKNPIDDIQTENGVWSMGTRVDNSGQYPCVAGGDWWSGSSGGARLAESSADGPGSSARVRLAVMFDKKS